jgi:C4-type Zn-finger protein
MRTCPDCPGQRKTKKYGEPTLSSGDILDQIIVCSAGCGWCGVDSVILSAAEAEKIRVIAERPKQLQLRMKI